MAKMSVSAKVARVLELLVGLSKNERARAALMAHGFDEADFEEGWKLLRAATETRFTGASSAEGNADPALLADLDAWENKWFPIAEATLRRRHAEVHAFVFHELKQAEGPAVILTVTTLLRRIAALEKATDESKDLADRKKAREVLTKRGLTKAVIAQAQSILDQIGTFGPVVDAEGTDDDTAKQEAAEVAAWAWFLEWSQITQSALTDRRALKQLGFLKSTGRKVASDTEPVDLSTRVEAEDAEDDVEEAEVLEEADDDEGDDDHVVLPLVQPKSKTKPKAKAKAAAKPAAKPAVNTPARKRR